MKGVAFFCSSVHIRTSGNQYAPHFFNFGGKNIKMSTDWPRDASVGSGELKSYI